MIFSYGITQQGAYHIKKDIVCQDAHAIVKCGDNMAIAAVADGLGSELYSDVASKMAVELSVGYCKENITPELCDDDIINAIHDAFSLSQNMIEKAAEEHGHTLDQYDTTLSLAVIIGDQLFYGHSGDSGIIALTTEGLYCKVTEQQRDSEGRVFPLFFREEKWVFGKYEKAVASVFLATDGMYEILFPVYIKKEPVSIYVALARFFMDPKCLRIEEDGEETVRDRIDSFVAGISEAQVNDDKTIAVIINSDVNYEMQSDDYYAEPDWNMLKKKYEDAWRREAYPHLYKDEHDSLNTPNE